MTPYGLSGDARESLALELEAIAIGLPGVAHLYQPRATLPALHAVRDNQSGETPPPPPRVEICDDGVISLTIATDNDSPSPQIAHLVHDTLAERLRQVGITVTRIDVLIARVD